MQTIKNGRKRGCGSCGQSESYESLQLNQPVIHGAYGGQLRATLSVLSAAGRNPWKIGPFTESPLDKELAA